VFRQQLLCHRRSLGGDEGGAAIPPHLAPFRIGIPYGWRETAVRNARAVLVFTLANLSPFFIAAPSFFSALR
jgi:hypothetical protein